MRRAEMPLHCVDTDRDPLGALAEVMPGPLEARMSFAALWLLVRDRKIDRVADRATVLADGGYEAPACSSRTAAAPAKPADRPEGTPQH